MNDAETDGLPAQLNSALRILREEAPVRDAWRASSLERLRDATVRRVQPGIGPGRWSMRPTVAIAAGLACAIVGAAATMAILRSERSETASLASETRAAPLAAPVSVLPVRFSLDAPAATTVSIVGDFNGWNPVALPMRRSADGVRWEIDVVLPPGRYSYAFVVDGRLSPDPRAPRAASDDFGMPNSVLMVRGS